jgi:hypothetical protein
MISSFTLYTGIVIQFTIYNDTVKHGCLFQNIYRIHALVNNMNLHYIVYSIYFTEPYPQNKRI